MSVYSAIEAERQRRQEASRRAQHSLGQAERSIQSAREVFSALTSQMAALDQGIVDVVGGSSAHTDHEMRGELNRAISAVSRVMSSLDQTLSTLRKDQATASAWQR